MFEKQTFQCPQCGYDARQELADGDVFTCTACHASFRAMVEEASGRVGLVEEHVDRLPLPLFLPQGSIRAGVSLAMAVSCWGLLLMGRSVPAYLLGLLLAIIGYYFGFRTKMKAERSHIYDASARPEGPLFMPEGVIRFVLLAGFGLSAAILLVRGQPVQPHYIEFAVILCGLIAGYVFGRVVAKLASRTVRGLLRHVKGLTVIAAAAALLYLFFSGTYLRFEGAGALWIVGLCSVVSFYFGSRH